MVFTAVLAVTSLRSTIGPSGLTLETEAGLPTMVLKEDTGVIGTTVLAVACVVSRLTVTPGGRVIGMTVFLVACEEDVEADTVLL